MDRNHKCDWNLNREISKLNYRIHTEAIKDNLIPAELTKEQIAYKYANEADLLKEELTERIMADVRAGIRTVDVLQRSIA